MDLADVPPVDEDAIAAARDRADRLAVPPGSLGRLADVAAAIAGLTGEPRPRLPAATVVLAVADHGVAREGVSAYPQSVTRAMLRAYVDGRGAVNALAASVGAATLPVDAGVDGPPVPGTVDERIRRGTDSLAAGPAMTREEARAAVDAGVRVAREAADDPDLLALGEMGIGNSTAAAAITAALTGADPAAVTGRGTGIDDRTHDRKLAIVRRALDRVDPGDPLGVLRQVGGFEIGLLAGAAVGAAADRTPVVIDGTITGAAALLAVELAPAVRSYLLPSHAAADPAAPVQHDALGTEPFLDLALRLGEGSAACLAIPTYRAACAALDGTATLDAVRDRE